MKIAWVCACPGEADYDVYKSCTQDGIDCQLYGLDNGWHFDKTPGVKFSLIDKQAIKDITADLTILRYPQDDWTVPQGKVVCWTSEQGPTRKWAKLSAARFLIVAVNNKVDLDHYTKLYPQKRILYLPFGGKRIEDLESKYEYDIITTSTPHYGCRCEGDLKKRSIETMVLPLLEKNIAIFGMFEGEHGWSYVPGIESRYKGHFNHWEYEHTLSKAKLNVDITFNWAMGGFGTKLARALATGIPVIWHQTLGMEAEGFIKGDQLNWSNSPEETQALVDHYLSHDQERVDMGKRGKEWFLKNWLWSKNLERIYNEF